jgi:phosphoserine phosphatase
MRLYIVRHGETQWNKDEVFRGRKDVPLNERGQQQAEVVGRYFQGKAVDRIVSSPLMRAVQTAQSISHTTGVPIEAWSEFTDIDFGIWEGLSLREVEERYPAELAVWRTSPKNLKIEAGETLAAVEDRISEGLKILCNGQEGAVVILTHRVICKLIVLTCLKMGAEHFWDMKYDPGSITLLKKKDHAFALVFSNQTCHLMDALPGTGYLDF